MDYNHTAKPPASAHCAQLRLLCNENTVLCRALASAQQRTSRLLADKEAEITNLCALLMQAQAHNIALETEIASLREHVNAAKTSLAENQTETVRQLAHQLLYQEARNARLMREIEHLRTPAAKGARVSPAHATPPPIPSADARTLDSKYILCISKHRKGLDTYRALLEAAGAQLDHHEGRDERQLPRLDAALCAADLVICQTGCLSHNAFWRVKEHCQLHGKRCVFVETPGSHGLAQGLRELLKDALAGAGDDVQNGSADTR